MSEWKNSNVSSSKTLQQYCKVCKQQVESTRALSSLPQMTDSSGSTEIDSVICPECTQTTTIDSAGPLSLIDSSNLDVSPNNAEQNTHDEIEILLASSEVKVDNAIKNLSISMIKLQRQLPVVRKDIEDNLCNFKQILGMCRDNAFVAMQEFHSQPWEMTDLFHDIHASADNIVKACESTKVVMNRLNSSELLCLNNSIGTQIINLTKYAFSTGLNMSELNESAPPPSSSEISPIVMINRLGIRIENKFGSFGASIEQLNAPHGFCLGADDEIVIADTNNHRIKIFAMNGTFKFQFGVTGTEEGQLQHPRKVAVMRASSKFVVCDRGQERSRMQIFSRNGEFINRIFITYINIVTCVAVTNDERIVVVDSVVPKVYFISEDGILIRWFEIGMHVMEPSDVAISGSDLYICDYKGHRVAVFTDVGKFQHHIGNEQVTNYPNGICISDAGDICIADSHGNLLHITCFLRDGVLQSQLICPYVKISRCCGLKITSDGCTVTVAKNNHQVLVLDTRFKFSG